MIKNYTKNNVLNAIESVIEKAFGRRVSEELVSDLQNELKLLSSYFKVNEEQALIIAVIFASSYQEGPVSTRMLCDFFKCTPINLIEYHNCFTDLENKGLVLRQKVKYKRGSSFGNTEYNIHELVVQAIIENQPIPEIKTDKFKDPIDFLEAIYKLSKEREEDNISTAELIKDTRELIEQNRDMALIKSIKRWELSIIDTYIFLYTIWKYLVGDELINVGKAFDEIFDHHTQKIRVVQKLYSGESSLLVKNLIEMQEAQFFDDTDIKLTNVSLNILHELGLHSSTKAKKGQLANPGNIPWKKLFYNDEEYKQIRMLQNILSENQFQQMKERLLAKSLNTGIAVLLYGESGTGKTESVYQIARESGREIMKVDISRTKSMWFGESEKLIKKIFNDYKSYMGSADLCPILLFNEADAVFSVRKESGVSNIEQTENTIQNIILDELENFQGILFATTNLLANLDKAFERRFLFKVRFDQPSIQNLELIWNDKMPYLPKQQCNELARIYPFSGGQVDNIARKAEMEFVFKGKYPDLPSIIELCNNELFEKKQNIKIGFKQLVKQI
jgi:DNA polymerase III delta prime subunit